jgi:probable rRNA maturation factor
MASLDVRNMTRRLTPRFAYQDAVANILPGWDISLVFVGKTRAKSLNMSLRKKDYVPNVLSYITGTKSGEVIICLEEAKKQAPSYELSYPHFVGFLLIHGLMHLKGHLHGPTMEKKERDHLARLISSPLPNETTHSNRHRYRHTPNTSRRR